MSCVAIIQARMGSSRLPGKVLEDVGGASVLARVVHRTRRARMLDAVVVATTSESRDDAVAHECQALGVPAFRGSEDDVLDRFYRAAQAADASTVVRICADCPLIDPRVIDLVVATFFERRADYASNTLERTFPRGLDLEVTSFETLERAWRQATDPPEREHVTPFIYRRPESFRLNSVTSGRDHSHHRWTVDTAEDLAFVRELYARLDNDDRCHWRDAAAVVNDEPELADLNRHVRQKPLEAC